MIRTAITTLAIAAVLGLGTTLDDHSAEQDMADDLQGAIQRATDEQRFAQAAQALCGSQAAWEPSLDGSVQCRTKHGRPTITVKVSP